MDTQVNQLPQGVRHIRDILLEVTNQIATEQEQRMNLIQLCADQDGYNANGQQCVIEVNGAQSIRLLSSLPISVQQQSQTTK